ncbi:MAG: hypothetical protein ACJ746_26490 [Bryobacteraceae bacterium]
MNKARTTYPIGVAGGVLSLAGVCIGIFSLGKSGNPRTSRLHSIEPPRGLPRPLAHPSDQVYEHDQLVEAYQPQELEIPTEPHGPHESVPTEVSVSEPLTPAEPAAEVRCSRVLIEDLARKGESPLAIAETLGISVGEVQLTLNLHRLALSASKKEPIAASYKGRNVQEVEIFSPLPSNSVRG